MISHSQIEANSIDSGSNLTRSELRFILSGGGTGGHIYPAIAIANELKFRFPNSKFLFVGAKDKMEMQKVPQAGYNIIGLWIAGLQRKLSFQNLIFPIKLISSLLKSRKIINQFKPNVVIGTGGFASGPLVQMANSLNIPTLIQEQNSYPGITNKLLSRKANIICVAYEKLERFFPKNKIILTGNPVRQDLLSIHSKREEALRYFNLDSNKKTLLVLGGSLGARRLNQLLAKEANAIVSTNIQIIWQCGSLYFDIYKNISDLSFVQVVPFIEKMDLAYAASDFIISRAGASSVSELCLVGKPVIFIPSPNVAEDHQTKNALAITEKGGALLIKEADLDIDFQSVFAKLVSDINLQTSLSLNINKLARPNATLAIVEQIEKLIGGTLPNSEIEIE